VSRYLDGRAYALRAPALQLLITLLIAAAGALFQHQVAISLLIGGLIGVAANTWLALVVFRPALGQPPHKMLLAFYLGQASKWLVSLILLALAFSRIDWLREPTYAALMLLAYVMTQLVAWLIAYKGGPVNAATGIPSGNGNRR